MIIARKDNSAKPFEDDPNIIVSNPFPIDSCDSEFHGSVDLTSIAPGLVMGVDKVECHVVIVPRDSDPRKALTLEHAYQCWARDYVYCYTDVSISKATVDNVLSAYRLLSPNDQAELVERINGLPSAKLTGAQQLH